MYGLKFSVSFGRLVPLVRRVSCRTLVLNRSRAFGAIRLSLPSFEMLNPKNFLSSGRATALFDSFTFSRSLVIKKRLILYRLA
jgi:hypothetical protein